MELSSENNGENLKTIRFGYELLPKWAQLLDIAARLTGVLDETRHWFSNFTRVAGVDDARTALEQCSLLCAALDQKREAVTRELNDAPAATILGAWKYALDTMIQEARGKQTCSWKIEGVEELSGYDEGGGDISLKRP